MKIDDYYVNALPILLKEHNQIEVLVVGCGGNGSFFVPMLSRLVWVLNQQGMGIKTMLIDPDVVESKNIPRQNFIEADFGLNKAEVLATRYSIAYGLKIGAIPQSFKVEMIKREWRKLIIIIGAVDNVVARQAIASSLNTRNDWETEEMPSVWWLDMGNHGKNLVSGQVLLGSTNFFNLEVAFNDTKKPSFCLNLPAPSLIHPELIQQEVLGWESNNLSCAEISLRESQALFINQRVACEAIEMLSQLIYSKSLKRFATYFHGGVGSSNSLYTAPKTLTQFGSS
jgi:PRTRC genetic system ThiF family protein